MKYNVSVSNRWWMPSAMVCRGSVVQKIVFGVTRWHALGRAVRWCKINGDQSPKIGHWSEESKGGEPR